MISHLDGTVCAIAPEGAVIEVGGVGLLVQCTPGTLATLRTGTRARMATSLVVREDALTLYGFASDDERDVFELAQTASGVGPRLALAMLASFSPDQLRRAIAAEDITALTRVPGIGRKGAQRIVLELAGRLGSPGMTASAGAAGTAVPGPRAAPWRDQVRVGLVNLGWPSRDAEQAIAAVEADLAGAASNGAAQNGAAGDGVAQDGAAQDGAAQNGAAGDGAAQDGAAQDGAAQDGAAQDGAARDGAAGDGQATGEVDVAQALRAALRKLSQA